MRPYSFLGTPRISGWGTFEDLAINKAFLSYAWTRSLEDLLTDTCVPDGSIDAEFHESALQITKSSAKHEAEMRSFEKVYGDEVSGLIQSYREAICQGFQPFAANVLRNADLVCNDLSSVEQRGLDLAYSVTRLKKPNRALPLIRILAGLHAFIRWQRRRSFKFGDFFDLRHAAAAIPYCDVFLTETFLKTACTSDLLDFATVYKTQIISDEDEAIDAISRLGAINLNH